MIEIRMDEMTRYTMITICSYVSLRHTYYKEPIHGIALGDDLEEKHTLGQLMDA